MKKKQKTKNDLQIEDKISKFNFVFYFERKENFIFKSLLKFNQVQNIHT